MNDVLELLKTRRSTPPGFLAAPGPDAGQLASLLEIAARVPDHGKLAPWRFIVFEGEARERAADILAELTRADRPQATAEEIANERKRLTAAPLVVAVVSKAAQHPKIPVSEQILSSAACCQNLLIAAQAMGFGAAWLTNWFAFDRRFLDRIGLAAHETITGFVHIGTRTQAIEERPRPALADIVTRF
ncbi:MAG: nitroreductase [Methylobacteriaceae bacterium]|nr:nitroreductase [Methylobacteriaceae bacterium]